MCVYPKPRTSKPQGNGETGVDKGGPCLPEHCFTFERGDETGPNCGGSCEPCAPAARRLHQQHQTLVCDVPAYAPQDAGGNTRGALSRVDGRASGLPTVAGWWANPSEAVQVAIPRQGPKGPADGPSHADTSCAGEPHSGAGGQQ